MWNLVRIKGKLVIAAIFVVFCSWLGPASGWAEPAAYQRILILSDAHLPFIPRETPDTAKEQRIVAAKQSIITDINTWDDVTRIVATGDLVGSYGTDTEYAAAKSFFGKLNKPVSYIVGNHDYMYIGRDPDFKFIRGNAEERRGKLERFKREYGQQQLYFTQEYGRYLLVFLSTDSLDSKVLCQFSQGQMSWLAGVLAKNPNQPTIIFAHAPLAGTSLTIINISTPPHLLPNRKLKSGICYDRTPRSLCGCRAIPILRRPIRILMHQSICMTVESMTYKTRIWTGK